MWNIIFHWSFLCVRMLWWCIYRMWILESMLLCWVAVNAICNSSVSTVTAQQAEGPLFTACPNSSPKALPLHVITHSPLDQWESRRASSGLAPGKRDLTVAGLELILQLTSSVGRRPWRRLLLPVGSTAPRKHTLTGNTAGGTGRTLAGDKPLSCFLVTSLWTGDQCRVIQLSMEEATSTRAPTWREPTPALRRQHQLLLGCARRWTTVTATGQRLSAAAGTSIPLRHRGQDSSASRRSSSCRRTRSLATRGARRCCWSAAEARVLLRGTVTCSRRLRPTAACCRRRWDRGSLPHCCQSRAVTRCPQSRGRGETHACVVVFFPVLPVSWISIFVAGIPPVSTVHC